MKIRELIEQLKEFDSDMDIKVEVFKKEIGNTWRLMEIYDVGISPDEDEARLYVSYW